MKTLHLPSTLACLSFLLALPVSGEVIVGFDGQTNVVGSAYDHESSGFSVEFTPSSWRFFDGNADGNASGEIRSWLEGGVNVGYDTRDYTNIGQIAEFQLDVVIHPNNLRESIAVVFENGWAAWPGYTFLVTFPINPSWAKDGVTVHTITVPYPATQPQGWFNRVSVPHYVPNNAGEFALSELRMTGIASAPAAPSGLGATLGGPTSVDLAWVDNATNETGYQIERSTDGITFAPLATTAADATSYLDTGLSAATTYYYRVSAAGAGGNSEPTISVSVTTEADYNTWKNALPEGAQAESDTPYSDGVPNLLRYALGLDPARALNPAELELLPELVPDTEVPGSLRFIFSLPSVPPADVRFAVLKTIDLSGVWQEIAAKPGRAAWSGTATVTESSSGAFITTSVPVDSGPSRQFLRLQVARLATP